MLIFVILVSMNNSNSGDISNFNIDEYQFDLVFSTLVYLKFRNDIIFIFEVTTHCESI
jgi:hypothetical protein